MTRIEPDGTFGPLVDDDGTVCSGVVRYFYDSTVLRAIDEARRDWDEADDPPLDSEVGFRDRAYAQGYRQACDDLLARFQPEEGDDA